MRISGNGRRIERGATYSFCDKDAIDVQESPAVGLPGSRSSVEIGREPGQHGAKVVPKWCLIGTSRSVIRPKSVARQAA